MSAFSLYGSGWFPLFNSAASYTECPFVASLLGVQENCNRLKIRIIAQICAVLC